MPSFYQKTIYVLHLKRKHQQITLNRPTLTDMYRMLSKLRGEMLNDEEREI